MARTIEKKPTPEDQAAAQAQTQKNEDLAHKTIINGITPEQQAIADEDEQYAKALTERADLTLIPQGKVSKNHTVKQVSDKVYPGGTVIGERL